jgi:hypothetical protein
LRVGASELLHGAEHNFIYDFKNDTAPKALKVLFVQSPPEAILCHGGSDYISGMNAYTTENPYVNPMFSDPKLIPTAVSARSYTGASRDGYIGPENAVSLPRPRSTADDISRSRPFAICYLQFVISFGPQARMKVGIVRVFYTPVGL